MTFLMDKYQRMGAGTVLAKKNLKRARDENKRIQERIEWNKNFEKEFKDKEDAKESSPQRIKFSKR